MASVQIVQQECLKAVPQHPLVHLALKVCIRMKAANHLAKVVKRAKNKRVLEQTISISACCVELDFMQTKPGMAKIVILVLEQRVKALQIVWWVVTPEPIKILATTCAKRVLLESTLTVVIHQFAFPVLSDILLRMEELSNALVVPKDALATQLVRLPKTMVAKIATRVVILKTLVNLFHPVVGRALKENTVRFLLLQKNRSVKIVCLVCTVTQALLTM